MDWQKLGRTVGKFAPMLGTVLGGPGGGAMGALVASALGVENNPDSIAKAVENDPEAAIKLRQVELHHKEQLELIAFKTLSKELGDKADAREAHKHNPMPAIICVSLTLMVAIGAWMLFTVDIPEANKQISYLLFGTVLAKWGDSIAYWVGTTRSSAEKDRVKLR